MRIKYVLAYSQNCLYTQNISILIIMVYPSIFRECGLERSSLHRLHVCGACFERMVVISDLLVVIGIGERLEDIVGEDFGIITVVLCNQILCVL